MNAKSSQAKADHEPGRSGGARALLAIPDFRRVWAAQTISDLGDGLTNLTLLIVVTQLTHSTAALAAIAIAIAVPTILVGPIAVGLDP